MFRPMVWRALALAVFAAGAPPAHAAEVYQVSTISSLLAGGYDGDTTVYSASRVLAARVDGRFRAIAVRSGPKQQPPYRPLAEVIKAQQVVHTFDDVDGTLIGFRFPAATTSVNVPGWHFHFLSADRSRGGHVLGLTTGEGLALLEEFSDLRIRLPARAPASSAGAEAIKAVERPQ